MAEAREFVPGLAGVPAARSAVGFIDGQAGKLQYRGYPVQVLAEQSTFEEVAWLLLHGELPTRDELESFRSELAEARTLDGRMVDALRALPVDGHPMQALAAGVTALGMLEPGDHVADPEYRRRASIRLIAQFPTIVAAAHRLRRGLDPIAPKPGHGHAQAFLAMLDGEEPPALAARIVDVALILHAEHGMNASTFTCRVTASTLASLHGSICAGVQSLSGPLHGGANERVLDTLRSIDDPTPAAVHAWAQAQLAAKAKIMGFGHRVYKVKDPRADILQGLARQLFAELGSTPIYDVATSLETSMAELVGPKGIYPNVDFYSGIVYEKLGIPTDLFTPVFAIARVAGWLGHVLEQLEDNRIFRPAQVYTGAKDRTWTSIEER